MIRVKKLGKARNEYIRSRLMELERLFPSGTIHPSETEGVSTKTGQIGTAVFTRRVTVFVEETSDTGPSEDRLSALDSFVTDFARYMIQQTRDFNHRISDVERMLEDITDLGSAMQKRTNREEALTLLKERLRSIPLPNPELQLLKTDPTEFRLRVIIDDTDKYFECLKAMASVVGELHRKYDFEIDVTLFQRSELSSIKENVEETITV